MTVLTGVRDDAFTGSFGAEPMLVQHDLSDHPLLEVERVAQLARAVPPDNVHHKPGTLDAVDNPDERSVAVPPDELVRTAEEHGRWVVVDNVEMDPTYRDLVRVLLGQMPPALVAREGGAITQEGQIFVSSAESIVPAHTDAEHNFLLQIRGRKAVTVARFPDEATRQRYLERIRGGAPRAIADPLLDERTYVLEPGDGIYLPPLYPHAVRVEAELSVSLSVYFETPLIRRAKNVCEVNRHLRRLRLHPRPPGEHAATDRAKETVLTSLTRLRALL